MKKIALLFTLALTAQTALSNSNWAVDGTISTIAYEDTDMVFFRVSNTDGNRNRYVCDGFYLQKTHPEFPEIYSTLVSAMLSGTSVTVWGTSECNGSNPKSGFRKITLRK